MKGNVGNSVSGEDVEEGMVPIYGKSIKDGTYEVAVESSSSMFKIFSCELTVLDGQMTAAMKLEGDSYTKVYPYRFRSCRSVRR